jgi:mRNA-degrading endonuclease RelE of RelBE toxin-antitoxin system
LRAFTARQRTTVLEAIEEQLSHQPLVETKQRKPLRPNPLAPWELRIGNFRVFYEVAADEPDTGRILAVGQKRGNKLYIGGQEIEL